MWPRRGAAARHMPIAPGAAAPGWTCGHRTDAGGISRGASSAAVKTNGSRPTRLTISANAAPHFSRGAVGCGRSMYHDSSRRRSAALTIAISESQHVLRLWEARRAGAIELTGYLQRTGRALCVGAASRRPVQGYRPGLGDDRIVSSAPRGMPWRARAPPIINRIPYGDADQPGIARTGSTNRAVLELQQLQPLHFAGRAFGKRVENSNRLRPLVTAELAFGEAQKLLDFAG